MAPKRAAAAAPAAPAIKVRANALKGEKCIITGDIEGMKRKEAEQILINAGATIEKSLNKSVTMAVLGAKAGPNKLEKIEELGINSPTWEEVMDDIRDDGGEDGDDGGDEPAAAEEDKMDEDEDDDDEEEEEEEKPKPKAKAKANTKAKAAPAPKAKAAAKAKPAAAASSSSSSDILSGKSVIVSGTIPGHDRKSANAIIENAGGKIAKSFNKSVELLILGTSPGDDKIAKAEELGVESIKWADLAEKLGIEAEPEKEVADVDVEDAPASIDGLTVLITGTVEGMTRSAAQSYLEGAGATMAKSLTKSVQLIVLGKNAGPDKLNEIAAKGIKTCQFSDLVEKLGLKAPEGPPKKKAKKN